MGTGIFLILLFLIFWTLFRFSEYPMNLVDSLMGAIKDFSAQIIPDAIHMEYELLDRHPTKVCLSKENPPRGLKILFYHNFMKIRLSQVQ